MSNFFSLQDGYLNDFSIYGYSLPVAEVMNNTTSIMLLTSSLSSTAFISNGSTFSAFAVHLSARAANPTGTLNFTIQRASNPKVFTDSSSNNLSITTVGSPYQTTHTPFSPNGWSGYFNGTTNFLRGPNPIALAGDFTIEMWAFFNAFAANRLLCESWAANIGWQLYWRNTSPFSLSFLAGSTVVLQDPSTTSIKIGQWHHIALTRSSGTLRMFVDGVIVASTTFNTAINPTANFNIGNQSSTNTNPFQGLISNLRVVQSQALYTTNFTPPTTKLGLTDNGGAIGATETPLASNVSILTLQDNRFKDNSNNNLTLNVGGVAIKDTNPFTQVAIDPVIHGASGYFNGSSYMSAPNSINYEFSTTTNYTIEFWFYPTVLAGGGTLYRLIYYGTASVANGNNLSWGININSGTANVGTMNFFTYNGTVQNTLLVTSRTFSINTWNHYALVNLNGSLSAYLNGVFSGSVNYASNMNTSVAGAQLLIGIYNGGEYFNGYMSNIRMYKGTALYTANFIPSPSPLTNTDNPILLLNTNNSYSIKETVSETYAVSGFTGYDGANNVLTQHPQNWQILKLTNPLSTNRGETISYSLNTSNSDQLSLLGSRRVLDATGDSAVTSSGTPILTSFKPYPNFNDSYFLNGTSWFTAPTNSRFGLFEDFTIEWWINTTAFSSDVSVSRRVFTFGADAGNALSVNFWNGAAASSNISIFANGMVVTGSIPVADGNWHHVAVTRYNNIIRLHVDGVQSGLIAINPTNFVAGLLTIGAYNNTSSGRLSAYINDFHIVNGTAKYTTSSFDRPTKPVEVLPDTVFLLRDGIRYDQALITTSTNTIPPLIGTTTLVNSPVLSSATPFSGGVDSSIRTLSSNPTTNPYVVFNTTLNATNGAIFGTNDFTIELFVNYYSILDQDHYFVNYATIVFGPGCIYFGRHPSIGGRLGFFARDLVSGPAVADPNPVNINEWIHYALVRYGNRFDLYRNGVSVANATYSGSVNSINPEPAYTGWFRINNGFVSNYRIVNGTAVYKSNFDRPTAPLDNVFNTVVLYKAPYNTSFLYSDTVDLNIGGSLKGLSTESRTITADTFAMEDLYIHNQGKLVFPQRDTKITISGPNGLQITSDGTLEIGTSANPISADVTSIVTLVSSQLDVHNGGNLNVYGAYKKPTTYLVNDSFIGQNSFNVVDNLSSTWRVDDVLVFTPNTRSQASFDVLTLSSFTGESTFTTTSNALFAHPSITTINYVPSISNLTRNVKIGGFTTSLRGDVRAIDAAKVNINNAQFNNMGKGFPSNYGLLIGTNNLGNINLSANSFINDNNTPIYTWTANRSSIANINISNNVIYSPKDFGMYFTAVSANNLIVNNNLILSAAYGGFYIYELSATNSNISNNIVAGNRFLNNVNGPNYGTYVFNSNFETLSGFINYNNANTGMFILSSNINTISNIINTHNNLGLSLSSTVVNTISNIVVNYNNLGGINLDASRLSYSNYKTSINNITANNNLHGIRLLGNNSNYITPFNINVNKFYSDGNITPFIGSNTVGVFSDWYCTNAVSGLNLTIGSGPTLINNLTSLSNSSNYAYPLVTKVGSVPIAKFSPFTGSYYNGNGNYHIVNTNTKLGFSTGDFTIECWVYRNVAFDSYNTIFTLGNLNDPGIILRCTAGAEGLYLGTTGYNWSPQTYITLNDWHHVAVVRRLSVINVYVNGTSRLTVSATQAATNFGTSKDLWVGCSKHTGGNESFNGYISNLRVSKSAVYTSNFNLSAPISPFTKLSAMANTEYLFNDSIDYYSVPAPSSFSNSYTDISLSGLNYSDTIINNYVTNVRYNSIRLDNTKFENFILQNSDLSNVTIPLSVRTTTNILEGSYGFHNNRFALSSVSAIPLNNYQSDTYTETGFAFMKHNSISENHFKISKAGILSLDKTVVNAPNTLSERLEPYSSTLKLRSVKLIPINKGDQYTVTVTLKKSPNYTGAAPRLMLKHNGSLGYNRDFVLATSVLGNDIWETLMGSLPSRSLDNGIIEVYVDCSGNSGSGYINIDSWKFL